MTHGINIHYNKTLSFTLTKGNKYQRLSLSQATQILHYA